MKDCNIRASANAVLMLVLEELTTTRGNRKGLEIKKLL